MRRKIEVSGPVALSRQGLANTRESVEQMEPGPQTATTTRRKVVVEEDLEVIDEAKSRFRTTTDDGGIGLDRVDAVPFDDDDANDPVAEIDFESPKLCETQSNTRSWYHLKIEHADLGVVCEDIGHQALLLHDQEYLQRPLWVAMFASAHQGAIRDYIRL